MISEQTFLRKVAQEKRHWSGMPLTEYVRGVLRGLELLKTFARELHAARQAEEARRGPAEHGHE